jgi:hypothetical protein
MDGRISNGTGSSAGRADSKPDQVHGRRTEGTANRRPDFKPDWDSGCQMDFKRDQADRPSALCLPPTGFQIRPECRWDLEPEKAKCRMGISQTRPDKVHGPECRWTDGFQMELDRVPDGRIPNQTKCMDGGPKALPTIGQISNRTHAGWISNETRPVDDRPCAFHGQVSNQTGMPMGSGASMGQVPDGHISNQTRRHAYRARAPSAIRPIPNRTETPDAGWISNRTRPMDGAQESGRV